MVSRLRVEIDEHIGELREDLAGAGRSLSPEVRVTAQAALVQAESMALLSDVLMALLEDGLQPLMDR